MLKQPTQMKKKPDPTLEKYKMKWSAYWWGTQLHAENQQDNQVIDALLERLDEKPIKTYDHGKLKAESIADERTAQALKTVTFNR